MSKHVDEIVEDRADPALSCQGRQDPDCDFDCDGDVAIYDEASDITQEQIDAALAYGKAMDRYVGGVVPTDEKRRRK